MKPALRWWRAPIWFVALFTGAKSFTDNGIIGSRRLNAAGLHALRLRLAHALARARRSRLRHGIPAPLREAFDRDGFVVVPNLLPDDEFAELRDAILGQAHECRAQQQGDTVTRRVAVGPRLRREVPYLGKLLQSAIWRGLIAYIATNRCEPLYYIQTISSRLSTGPRDPQLELHSDTFHPSLKAWLFLTDVRESDRPLTYVAGSHRLSPERLEWERSKSVEVVATGDALSKRGSLRVRPEELTQMGLPSPTRFCVPANTLVVIDTCGFHARGHSPEPSVRVELWAYCRRNPFIPWVSAGPLSSGPLGARQSELLFKALDWLDRLGLRTQHWKTLGRRRPSEP